MSRLRVLVNRHRIKANKDHDSLDPPFSIQRGGRVVAYAHEVRFDVPVRLVYSPDKPLKCGATVWLEAEGELERSEE